MGLSGGSVVKTPPANASINPWVGKISWRGSYGCPLQYSCRENPIDKAWQATVHGVAKESITQLGK